ncbi:MAG: response regulator [Deltaproteobacteria bacterium]|nr:response regulator [Deltaproteobacteria bacterium]
MYAASTSPVRTAILRAELHRADTVEITCALEMTAESVFLVTDELPPVGAVFQLRLSFPSAVEPLDLVVEVVQVRLSSGPGAPSGFVGSFLQGSDVEGLAASALARRLTVPPKAIATRRELSVLLVEDTRLVRDMFAYALDRYFEDRAGRVRLDQAADVATAWEMLSRSRYDLVIVDHFLHGECGALLISRLRSHPTLVNTRVVAISVGGPEVRRESFEAGADLFLQKPIALRELFYTLEFLMGAEGDHAGAP